LAAGARSTVETEARSAFETEACRPAAFESETLRPDAFESATFRADRSFFALLVRSPAAARRSTSFL
jgi:hypothetical protein